MNIRYSILAVALLISAANYAQKSEIKALTKIVDKKEISDKDLSTYITNANALSQMTGLSDSDQVAAKYFKAMTPVVKALADMKVNPAAVTKSLNTKTISEIVSSLNEVKALNGGSNEYSAKVTNTFAQLESIVHQVSMAAYSAKKTGEASLGFEALYNMNNTKQEYLYNAAVLAHQDNDFDRAISIYKKLLETNYTGESINYFATNKASGGEEFFDSKVNRDKAIATKVYEKPRDEKIPSKRGEIYKSVVNLLIYQNKTEDAKGFMAEARKLNPKDTDLILAEANLYLQAGEKAKYSSLIQEAIALKPNDAVLYYNVGVVAAEAKDVENAEKYYKKAIELNPKDFNSYNNLGVLYFQNDAEIVNKMNALGMSKKEQVEYDALAAKRKANFNKALPYFEKAYEIQPSEDLKSLLLKTYRNLELDAKYNALKNK